MASATVLLLVGAAVASRRWSRCPTRPKTLAAIILSLSENPLILLFLINVLLFIVGMFLDAAPRSSSWARSSGRSSPISASTRCISPSS
jgi:TRAP-type C4-dicarboxylate transport system permease large subunit